MIIKISDKEYKVKVASTDKEREKGLQGVKSLPKDEGMLFIYDEPQKVSMWMKDTLIPLDIVFINEDQEVIQVNEGVPEDEHLMTAQNVSFVLEVSSNSGIQEGDELELQDDEDVPVMKVLFPDGSEQMALYGGERIFSRKNTKVLIKKAKKAQNSQSDSDYKALGRYMFKCIKIQDERDPEYVEAPKSNN